jgi:hypothetical protein
MRTSLQSGVDAAAHYLSFGQDLSFGQAGEKSFHGELGALPDPVWRALLTLFVMQAQGKPCRISDMFPGPQVSDRTRLLYIRLMVQRGLLYPSQLSYNSESAFRISDVASQALLEILKTWRCKSSAGCLDLVPF